MGKLQTCFTASPGTHSAKPNQFYQEMANHFPGPRLDVFARQHHPGFDGWGNEYEPPHPDHQQTTPRQQATGLTPPRGRQHPETKRTPPNGMLKRLSTQENLIHDDYEIPVNDGSPAAQQRAVSMIRHEFTNYQKLLDLMPRSRNMETNTLIYWTLKSRVVEAIAQSVPELAQACRDSVNRIEQ